MLLRIYTTARVKEQYTRVKDRPINRKTKLSGNVLRVLGNAYTKEDKQYFGLEQKKQVYEKGDARISISTLPYSSTRPASIIRRTVLPQFVAIIDNYETMEVPNIGIQSILSTSYRDLTIPTKTPLGKSNVYSAIPYYFPIASLLPSANILSNALVGRIRQDIPSVITARDHVLGDPITIDIQIKLVRESILEEVYLAFDIIKRIEKEIFRE